MRKGQQREEFGQNAVSRFWLASHLPDKSRKEKRSSLRFVMAESNDLIWPRHWSSWYYSFRVATLDLNPQESFISIYKFEDFHAMNEGSQLDLPSWPFTRPFYITMALFQLHQSIKMKRCRSICFNSGFFSKKIFLHVNGTYRVKISLFLLAP